jgi:hypothetical protein
MSASENQGLMRWFTSCRNAFRARAALRAFVPDDKNVHFALQYWRLRDDPQSTPGTTRWPQSNEDERRNEVGHERDSQEPSQRA